MSSPGGHLEMCSASDGCPMSWGTLLAQWGVTKELNSSQGRERSCKEFSHIQCQYCPCSEIVRNNLLYHNHLFMCLSPYCTKSSLRTTTIFILICFPSIDTKAGRQQIPDQWLPTADEWTEAANYWALLECELQENGTSCFAHCCTPSTDGALHKSLLSQR